MASTSALGAAGLNVCELRQIIKLDREASNELQTRIDIVRKDIKNGARLPEKTVEMMESLNKDMTRDLVQRIDKIEGQGVLTSTDRELLQALNAQLATCDRSGMQLAELRDLEQELDRRKRRDSMYKDALPLGGTPRKPSRASTLYTPAEVPHTCSNDLSNSMPPPPPYTASHGPRYANASFTPPLSSSPRSSNPSLERTNSQDHRRKSMERSRQAFFMPSTPPPGSTFMAPPSPPVMHGSAPSASHFPKQSYASSSRSVPPPSPPIGTPTYAPPEPVRRNSQRTPTGAGAGEYQYYSYADYDSDDEDIHAEWSKTDWPLLYRILDIDPSTDSDVLLLLAKRQLERLSLRHNPGRFPNDPDAPTRWIAINKAYDVLTHPERKRYYDTYGREPEEVEGINLDELRIS